MPRTPDQPVTGLDELLAELEGADVVNLPTDAPADRERALGSLLAFTLFFTRRQKRVEFPETVDWDAPGFTVVDDMVRVPVTWARASSVDDVAEALRRVAARADPDATPPLVALDALDASEPEFRFTHALYGDPVLLAFRVRPPRERDPRIDAAREAGWARTLKEHNLLPGRGLFIPDEKLGWFLTEDACREVRGVHLLLPDGTFSMNLNPFSRNADPELQHWLTWGRGGEASEWQDVLMVDEDEAARFGDE